MHDLNVRFNIRINVRIYLSADEPDEELTEDFDFISNI